MILFRSLFFLLLTFLFTKIAIAREPDIVLMPGDSGVDNKSLLSLDLRYQIGSEWGKKEITLKNLKKYPQHFRNAARATVRVSGGTGFYLGKFQGKHLLASNHHVLPNAQSCLGKDVHFKILNKKYKCTKYFGHWTNIDFSLFSIDVEDEEDEIILEQNKLEFNFDQELRQNQELLTIGFGIANNPLRRLVGDTSKDCKVFSKLGEYKFMSDPDAYNPGSYKAWSFALGCDVSHGDSGSAIVDRNSGKVVGIIWTGRIPKSSKVQSSKYLDNLLKTDSSEIWTELNYAVPAEKIKEFLLEQVALNSFSKEDEEVLLQFLES